MAIHCPKCDAIFPVVKSTHRCPVNPANDRFECSHCRIAWNRYAPPVSLDRKPFDSAAVAFEGKAVSPNDRA